jgi:hypothetical protein
MAHGFLTAVEAVKRQTISRKDAKAQRLAKNNCLVLLRLLQLCAFA